jgi:hypothetical protein
MKVQTEDSYLISVAHLDQDELTSNRHAGKAEQ